MALWEQYGVDADERERRKAFLNIAPDDGDRLRGLRAAFREHSLSFAERFYRHLLDHQQTADLLRDPEQLARLKHLQAEYFADLLEGVFDEDYFEGRLRVGVAHQKAGLDPTWYLGAYNQYIQLTFPLFARASGDNLDAVLPRLLSLVKVIFLDIGLALHTYFHAATDALRCRNDELEQALTLYWQTQRREEQLRKLISHEVRGGLAAVIAGLEDLADVAHTQLDPAAADQLDAIRRRCWSLSGVMTEMLSSDPTAQGPAWVETAPIFESLLARFGLYAGGRRVELRLPTEAPRVWADGAQLREVFANLVSNAVRHLDKEPGRVEVSCQADGDFVLFGVADNGCGIAPEVRDRIFEPFARGPAASGRPEGTGLGLYFVRTVIEQGGGRVWAESEPGQGTRFWFTVRRQPTPAKPRPADRAAGDASLRD